MVALLLVSLYYWFSVRPTLNGDLGYLGVVPFPEEYSRDIRTKDVPPKLYNDFQEGGADSVLTIGDSYSNLGLDSYVNYLAKRLGGGVANFGVDFSNPTVDPEQIYAYLINTGLFERNPQIKVVVVESAARRAIGRLCSVDLTRHPLDSVRPFVAKATGPKGMELFPIKRCIEGGLHWMNMASGIGDNPVKKADLSLPLFTVKGMESKLYFLEDDLKGARLPQQSFERAKQSLIRMEEMARERGVRFFYLVPPDKYEVYAPYIVENPYPSVNLSGQIAKMFDSIPYAVSPIRQLQEMLASGVKDVWKADDTHWSYKASEMVGDIMADRITSETSAHDSIQVKAANAVKNP